jgi:hypothetical protein
MKKPTPSSDPVQGLPARTARPRGSTAPTLIGPPVFRPRPIQPKIEPVNSRATHGRAVKTMIQAQEPDGTRAAQKITVPAVYKPLQPTNVGRSRKPSSEAMASPPDYRPGRMPAIAQAKIAGKQASVGSRQGAFPVQLMRAASAQFVRVCVIQRVKCAEGEVKTAAKDEEVDFGGVTSCMTITCVLEDGRKVSAHEGLEKRVSGGAYSALKAAIGTQKVVKVLAAGGGNYWSPNLETSGQIIGDTTHLSFLQEQELLERSRSKLIVGAKSKFVAKLKSEFGTDDASFEDWDMGALKISTDNKVTH